MGGGWGVGVPSSYRLPPVNVNRPFSITSIQTHLIQFVWRGGGERLEGMQINPQVNTGIIRSVTLQHCPTGMCEFHLECSQMDDNSANWVQTENPISQKCVCACFAGTVFAFTTYNDKCIHLDRFLLLWGFWVCKYKRSWSQTKSKQSNRELLVSEWGDRRFISKQITSFSAYPTSFPMHFFRSTELKKRWIPNSTALEWEASWFSVLAGWSEKRGLGEGMQTIPDEDLMGTWWIFFFLKWRNSHRIIITLACVIARIEACFLPTGSKSGYACLVLHFSQNVHSSSFLSARIVFTCSEHTVFNHSNHFILSQSLAVLYVVLTRQWLIW